MISLAHHMRLTNLRVSNEDVDAAKAAVDALTASWGATRSVPDLVRRADAVAGALGGDGRPAAALGEEVQAVMQEHASAFVHEDRPLDVGIVAAAAFSRLLDSPAGESGFLVADVSGAAMWSALGFQPLLDAPKREALRAEILGLARDRALRGAEAARERVEVDDFGTFEPGTDEEMDGPFKQATRATVAALRRNAALDREEIDFLWWSQSSRCPVLNRPFSTMAEPTRAVARGVGAARHLRRLPCDAHRDLVVASIADAPGLSLPELLAAMGEGAAVLGRLHADVAAESPGVFPLLHALGTGEASPEGAAVSRTPAEWGGRALLEAALAGLWRSGPRQL